MRPDPWAVVEHHARAMASGSPEDELTSGQRLALYAAGAHRVAEEFVTRHERDVPVLPGENRG